MLEDAKKKITKTAMKLMMNEKVARTLMSAFQKKNDLNERMARVYASLQVPSLADHDSVLYALERLKRRIKGLEKELSQAEFALEKVDSALDRTSIASAVDIKPATASRKAPKKPKAMPKAKRAAKRPPSKKPSKLARPAKIEPLGAAASAPANSGGLLDLDFKKGGKKKGK